jgi:DNA helicase-2/ATP-dependent DNA helicase PcrA
MMDGLNPAQQEAVNTLAGPLLVLAGAGSGKTRVVTYRIANLIRHGVPPPRILAVTFTNKAALEMQQRIAALLAAGVHRAGPAGRDRPAGSAGRAAGRERPVISTFHAHCVQILRRHARTLGYPPRFAIYDRGDQESVARGVLRDIRVPSELIRPSDLIAAISRWKTLGVSPAQAAQLARSDQEHLAAAGYRRYQQALWHAGAVDFDDLLLLTERLFVEHPQIRKAEAALFDHLLVDEYQDTNAVQYRIVQALASEHRNLCVVGDDDQSIYGWRGAQVEHILRFTRDWPDAKVIRLEWNYRSTAAILEAANRLIAFNRQRHPKTLRAARAGGEPPRILQYPTETDEARETVADIRRRLASEGWQPRDFAILFRTNDQQRPFETELRRARIPYVVLAGQSFFDYKEVKDILAYLRLLTSPQDEVSLLRILNTPPRGIGPKTVETLLRQAASDRQSIWSVMQRAEVQAQLPAAARDALRRFVDQVEGFRQQAQRASSLSDFARQLIASLRYREEIDRTYADPPQREARWNMVEEVVNALAAYEQGASAPTLDAFLDEVTLGQRELGESKEKQLAHNAVVLMTLHAAKGLEFPHVYMVGMEEGILPHHRSLSTERDDVEEERRLCYVGMTRAQERLTLSLSLTRLKWGKPRPSIPSRFLFEIIGQAERAVPAAARNVPAAPAPAARPLRKRP